MYWFAPKHRSCIFSTEKYCKRLNSSIENVKSVDQRYTKTPQNSWGTDHPAMKKKYSLEKSCLSCGVRNHFIRNQECKYSDHDERGTQIWWWRWWQYMLRYIYITSVILVQVNTTNSPFDSEIYVQLIIGKQRIEFLTVEQQLTSFQKNITTAWSRLRMWSNSEVTTHETTEDILYLVV